MSSLITRICVEHAWAALAVRVFVLWTADWLLRRVDSDFSHDFNQIFFNPHETGTWFWNFIGFLTTLDSSGWEHFWKLVGVLCLYALIVVYIEFSVEIICTFITAVTLVAACQTTLVLFDSLDGVEVCGSSASNTLPALLQIHQTDTQLIRSIGLLAVLTVINLASWPPHSDEEENLDQLTFEKTFVRATAHRTGSDQPASTYRRYPPRIFTSNSILTTLSLGPELGSLKPYHRREQLWHLCGLLIWHVWQRQRLWCYLVPSLMYVLAVGITSGLHRYAGCDTDSLLNARVLPALIKVLCMLPLLMESWRLALRLASSFVPCVRAFLQFPFELLLHIEFLGLVDYLIIQWKRIRFLHLISLFYLARCVESVVNHMQQSKQPALNFLMSIRIDDLPNNFDSSLMTLMSVCAIITLTTNIAIFRLFLLHRLNQTLLSFHLTGADMSFYLIIFLSSWQDFDLLSTTSSNLPSGQSDLASKQLSSEPQIEGKSALSVLLFHNYCLGLLCFGFWLLKLLKIDQSFQRNRLAFFRSTFWWSRAWYLVSRLVAALLLPVLVASWILRLCNRDWTIHSSDNGKVWTDDFQCILMCKRYLIAVILARLVLKLILSLAIHWAKQSDFRSNCNFPLNCLDSEFKVVAAEHQSNQLSNGESNSQALLAYLNVHNFDEYDDRLFAVKAVGKLLASGLDVMLLLLLLLEGFYFQGHWLTTFKILAHLFSNSKLEQRWFWTACVYRRVNAYWYLQTIRIPSKQELDELEDFCVICQDVIPADFKYAKVTTCGHFFHDYCLLRWLRIRLSCPICYQNVN